MFFISKFLIIILLIEIYGHLTRDMEIILLPASNPTGVEEIPIALKVFGQLIKLNLRRSDTIVSPAFGKWKYNAKGVAKKLFELNVSSHCFYYHEDHISSAAIDFCYEHGLEGHVIMENNTLEIRPLRNEFTSVCLIDDFKGQLNFSFGKPYVIKKSMQYFANSNHYHWDMFKQKRRHVRNAQQNLTVKLAVFVDEAAYNTSILDNDEDKLRNIILAYVNRIQAAFNRPNLDVFINITLIRLKMLTPEQSNLSVSDGNAGELLSSFCKYANSLNSPNNNDPYHWDIALYLTGIKLYENVIVKFKTDYKNEKNFQITGYAYFNGVCKPLLSCAIAEFRDKSEVDYPLTAIKMIGELLGLIPERSSSDLERNITWSKDSRKKMETLWEEKTCLRDEAKTMISEEKNGDIAQKNLIIELVVFFDEAAYNMYMPILDNDEDKLRNMILAYVNQIQAFFHHPSFGAPVDISLIRLLVMNEQSLNLPVFDGDSDKLLNLFCEYATTYIPHWDIGLYITGIDLYEMKNEQKYYDTLGRSYVNLSCRSRTYSCGIVEFGTTRENAFSGFAMSRAATHEIAHVLGINHDEGSIDSTCQNGKYMMADKLFLLGQTTWSECSRNVTKELWKTKQCLLDHTRRENTEDPNALDHSRYHDLPGRQWTAKAQCELFLRDKDANVVTLHDICQVLQCETPHENKYFFAGPALDGTNCALEKECRSGECVPVIEPPLPYCEEDNWSEWKEDSCKSDCLTKSKGVVIKRRSCKHGINKTASCNGPYYDVVLCNDSRLCTEKRKTIDEYTASKCTEFSLKLKTKYKVYFNYIPEIGPGQQNSHDARKPWIACTIYCQREEKISAKYSIFYFYTPRQELLESGVNPYFPDGTWCHEKDGQDYYCRQHYCLPENYSIEE
ncbi:uncharacterized protein [Linepithema humile]|uniref:uncharacterized protein n=1 Tax=Linepithema humile TaxID=83485 RepID=UPI00351DB651